jgi:hypothetical protein
MPHFPCQSRLTHMNNQFSQWLLEHSDDPGMDDPIEKIPAVSSSLPIVPRIEEGSLPGVSISDFGVDGGNNSGEGIGSLVTAENGDVDEFVLPPVDEQQLAMLMDFGFAETAVRRCLMQRVGGHYNSVDEAAEWLFEHADDPALDEPIEKVPRSSLVPTMSPSFSLPHQDGSVPSSPPMCETCGEWPANVAGGHASCCRECAQGAAGACACCHEAEGMDFANGVKRVSDKPTRSFE